MKKPIFFGPFWNRVPSGVAHVESKSGSRTRHSRSGKFRHRGNAIFGNPLIRCNDILSRRLLNLGLEKASSRTNRHLEKKKCQIPTHGLFTPETTLQGFFSIAFMYFFLARGRPLRRATHRERPVSLHRPPSHKDVVHRFIRDTPRGRRRARPRPRISLRIEAHARRPDTRASFKRHAVLQALPRRARAVVRRRLHPGRSGRHRNALLQRRDQRAHRWG